MKLTKFMSDRALLKSKDTQLPIKVIRMISKLFRSKDHQISNEVKIQVDFQNRVSLLTV